MATIKFGGLISDARGSVGGVVLSRNASGAYAKQRTTPINPKTVLQMAIRAILSFVAQLYKSGTTAAQKSEWAVYAANMPKTNKVGETITHSGYNAFVGANTMAKNAGLPEILDGPANFTLPGDDPTLATVVSEAGQTIAVTFDDTRDWVDEDDAAMLVYMGIPQDDSIEFFDGPWRYAGAILGDGVTPPVTGATVAVPFPVVAAQKIFTQAAIIRADGRYTSRFRTNAIAGA